MYKRWEVETGGERRRRTRKTGGEVVCRDGPNGRFTEEKEVLILTFLILIT